MYMYIYIYTYATCIYTYIAAAGAGAAEDRFSSEDGDVQVLTLLTSLVPKYKC